LRSALHRWRRKTADPRAFGAPRAETAAAERIEAVVAMHWSLVHGLATLLLDGSLGRRLDTREAREARDAHIARTLALFTDATESLTKP
jgi:hypothetical protein